MSTYFKDIKLENLYKDTAFSHSRSLYDLTDGKAEADKNIDYTEKLLSMDKTSLTDVQFDRVSALSSVIAMNYQICNGGIGQYYYNGYDTPNEPYHEQDTKRVDKNEQVKMLRTLHDFGTSLFLERTEDNQKLESVIDQFEKIHVANEEQFETVYSDEDALIWDEEIGEWIDNPAYEEPYEISLGYEDILKEAEHFDDAYYDVNDYLESLFEGYAQYLYKSIEKENEKLPLDALIQTAKELQEKDKPKPNEKEPER